jgi:hypothetical protein
MTPPSDHTPESYLTLLKLVSPPRLIGLYFPAVCTAERDFQGDFKNCVVCERSREAFLNARPGII